MFQQPNSVACTLPHSLPLTFGAFFTDLKVKGFNHESSKPSRMGNAKTKTFQLLLVRVGALLVWAAALCELQHILLVWAPWWLVRAAFHSIFCPTLCTILFLCNAYYPFGHFSQGNDPHFHAQIFLEHANSTSFQFGTICQFILLQAVIAWVFSPHSSMYKHPLWRIWVLKEHWKLLDQLLIYKHLSHKSQ